MAVPKKLTGQILVQMGLISQEQLDFTLAEQKRTQQKIGRLLVQRGVLTEQQLIEALEIIVDIPRVQIDEMNVDPEIVKQIPVQLIRRYKVFPVARYKNDLTVAMVDHRNHQAIEDIQMATGLNVNPVLAGELELDNAIGHYLAFNLDSEMRKVLDELNLEPKTSATKEPQTIKTADDAPIIRMVNSTLLQAINDRASDVHIEPLEGETRVRFRVDGRLNTVFTIPELYQAAVASRLKIMSGMDIAEKRIPQDGRFCLKADQRQVDFRVSTLPVSYGEKVVLRILDRANTLKHINNLGFSSLNKKNLLSLASRPYGMVLVTGPTSSGKTTTLYSILNEVNSTDRNIITLEDPVEYTLKGINQVQTNPRAGLTFASGLRSCLRQDPDIIMVGEIRDQETAELAIQAALTGHLVFSTLHTSSAIGALARLKDMGIEDFLLGSSLSGIVAQRLIRRLCKNCRESYILDQEMARRLGIPEHVGHEYFRAVGCNGCRQLGYQGRLAIHEILMISNNLRTVINRGEHDTTIIEQAASWEGFINMKQDGIKKARQGLTSLEEVMKAVLLEE